jgi:hypothetical protein
MPLGSLAVPAVFRSEKLFVPQMGQGPQVMTHLKDNIAAPPAVSSIGPPPGHVLFPAETDTTISTLPRRDFNQRFIGKFLHYHKILKNTGINETGEF